ncbi:biopolymer transporter ExbD, partial [Acinetobacter baumannii]
MTIALRRHRKRKLKAEINVVPYIDVMLVLLIIFMVTAPLLNLGVDVDLPQSNAKSIQEKKDPVIVTVDRDGNYFLAVEAGRNEA